MPLPNPVDLKFADGNEARTRSPSLLLPKPNCHTLLYYREAVGQLLNLADFLDSLDPDAGGGGGIIPLFSASRDTSDQTSGSTAIFNNVATLGGFNDAGYDPVTGVFTAPVTDKYSFRTQLVTRAGAEASFQEAIFALYVDGSVYAFGGSFPDPATSAEQLPALITLGPILLTIGQQVTTRRVGDTGAAPALVDFNATIRLVAHPACRFEGWRAGA